MMASSLSHTAHANKWLPASIAIVCLAASAEVEAQQAQPAATFGPGASKAIPGQSTIPAAGSDAVDGRIGGAAATFQLPASSGKLGSTVREIVPTAKSVEIPGPVVIDTAVDKAAAIGGATGRPGGAAYNLLTQPLFTNGSGDGWHVGIVTPLTANASDAKWAPPTGVQASRIIKFGDTLSGNLVAGAYCDTSRLVLAPTVKLRARFEIGF